MVTKNEAIECIMKPFYNWRNNTYWTEMEDYLKGARKEKPTFTHLKNMGLYSYSADLEKLKCFDEMGNMLEGEASEILKKFTLAFVECPYLSVVKYFERLPERYSLYKEVDFPEKLIIEDVNLRTNLNEEYFLYHQEKVADYYFTKFRSFKKEDEVFVLVLLISKIFSCKNSKKKLEREVWEKYKDRVEEFKLILEELGHNYFVTSFRRGIGLVEELVKEDKELEELLEIVHFESEMALEMSSQRKINILEQIFMRVTDEYITERLRKIIRGSIQLKPETFLYNRRNIKFLLERVERFDIDDSYAVEYVVARGLSIYPIEELDGTKETISKVVKENPQYVRNFLKKNKNSNGTYVLYMAIKEGILESDEKKELIMKYKKLLIESARKLFEENADFKWEFPNESYKTYEFLNGTDFPEIKVIKMERFNFVGLSTLILKSLFLLDYSNIAINLLKIMSLVKKNYRYYANSIQEYFESYKILCDGNDILERFYSKGIPYESLLEYCVKYPGVSREELYNFAINHIDETNISMRDIRFDCIEDCEQIVYPLFKNSNAFDPKVLLVWADVSGAFIYPILEGVIKNYEKELREEVQIRTKSKSKSLADMCSRLIKYWDNLKAEEKLKDITTLQELEEYIETLYDPKCEKILPYKDLPNYSFIREKDSNKFVNEKIIKFYISEYMRLKSIYIVNICEKIAKMVNVDDLRKLVFTLYEKWLADGSEAKTKNILLPLTLLSTPSELELLKKQLKVWIDEKRMGAATFIVQCIASKGDKASLTFVDTVAKKEKNKKIKNTAIEALEMTAEMYGLTMEELEEKIIPNFDFDKNRERFFDYGERKIKGVLNSNLEIILFDQTGKNIKSLPKVSEKFNDDEKLVEQCKEELKVVKKQLKTVADFQKLKVQKAVLMRKTWQVEKWKELFIENVLMNAFAIGLIWEEKDSLGNVLGRFRYMEDGTFTTFDEEEYFLNENSFVSPVNLRGMSDDEREGWKEQLEDYEIVQPVKQLSLEVLDLRFLDSEKEEKEWRISEKELGKSFYQSNFKKVMDKYNFKYSQDYDEGLEEATYEDKINNVSITIVLKEPFFLFNYEETSEISHVIFRKIGDKKFKFTLGNVPVEILDFVYFVMREIVA